MAEDDPWSPDKLVLTERLVWQLGFSADAMRAIRARGAPLRALIDPVRLRATEGGGFAVIPLGIEVSTDAPGESVVALQDSLPPGYRAFAYKRGDVLTAGILKTPNPFKPVSTFLTLGAVHRTGRREPHASHPVVAWLRKWNRQCRFGVAMVGDYDLWVTIRKDALAARDPAILDELLTDAASICAVLHDDADDWAVFVETARREHVLPFHWDPVRLIERALATIANAES